MFLFPLHLPYIDPVAFYILEWPIKWYGISYMISFYLTWFLSKRYMNFFCTKWHIQNLDVKDIDNLLTYGIIGVIIGGRLGHMIFYDFDTMVSSPITTFKTWEGGMAFHGGLIGFAIALITYAIKKKLNIKLIADIAALVAPVGIFFVRIGNFINNELIGRPTSFFISVIPHGHELPGHPSQIYEALFEGLFLHIILLLYFKKSLKLKNQGSICALFLMLYGVFRFFLEYLREPSDGIFNIFGIINITYGQILTLPMLVIGVFIWKRVTR